MRFIKRLLALCALGVISPLIALGQFTSVSATITDSDGQTWNGGTFSWQLVLPNGASTGFYNGAPVTLTSGSGGISSGGVISTGMWLSNTITPTVATYAWTICSKTSAKCSTFNAPVTSANMSAALSALVIAPRFPASSSAYGYLDVEVSPVPTIGSTYYNVTQLVTRQWNGTAWVNSGGGGGSSTYIGLVGTRGLYPQSQNTSLTWIMARTGHYARTNIAANGQQVMVANTFTGTGVYKVSIEYPVGVFTLCTWSSATTITMATQTTALSDGCGPVIASGQKYWVRILYTNPAGMLVVSFFGGISEPDDGAEYGTGTPTDLTTSGTVPGNINFLGPMALVGPTTQASGCLLGDSRVFGNNDTLDVSLDSGELARIIGPTYAYANLGLGGEATPTGSSNYSVRAAVLQYCTFAIDEYGFNNFLAGGSTSTVLAARSTFENYLLSVNPALTIYGSTIPVGTSSTDGWITTANQTTTTDTRAFNSSLLSGNVATEQNVLDVAGALDPNLIGLWPVSYTIGATSGQAFTSDGIHESANASKGIIRMRLGYTSSWFKR